MKREWNENEERYGRPRGREGKRERTLERRYPMTLLKVFDCKPHEINLVDETIIETFLCKMLRIELICVQVTQ